MAKAPWVRNLPNDLGGIEKVTGKEKKTPVVKRIIAWDGEGMNLSGKCQCISHGDPDEKCEGKPQHYVLFGCSAEVDSPLIGKNLTTDKLLDYIISIGEKYPKAVHVSYSFKYDFNMIIKGLSVQEKVSLHTDGKVVLPSGLPTAPRSWGYRYVLEYIPGKIFRVSRMDRTTFKTVSVRIYDLFTFFARAFLPAAESILSDELTTEDREVIEYGKKDRGTTEWVDIQEVTRYWQAEIRIMQRMTERFRDIMYAAGLKLTAWYGPGAIAGYLIKTRKLQEHIQNEPPILAVHEASKYAYAGGRFELFQLGRFTGDIKGLDINSAYPYALSGAPSLGLNHGEWVHVEKPQKVEEFGVYRISFRGSSSVFEYRAMPLFHRDKQGGISFPGNTDGWYWSPEASVVASLGKRYGGVVIHEGWVWENDNTRPFRFLEEMYNRRMQLGKDNIISMPYKLGPNSMYGKLAQQVGYHEGKYGKPSTAPDSHCLALAGWITSKCRAELYKVMVQIPPEQLIAVETDGIFTTADLASIKHISYGSAFGQWDVSEYQEMLYLRNGIYHRRSKKCVQSGCTTKRCRKDDHRWSKPKSRGLDISSVPRSEVQSYLQRCGPGDFPVLEVPLKERFVGLGAALAGGPDTMKERHAVWVRGKRDVLPGGNGKRTHVPKQCPSCIAGLTAWDAPHPLVIHSNAGINSPLMSTQHTLEWETKNRLSGIVNARRIEAIEGDYL
jgi:hypothetical protein